MNDYRTAAFLTAACLLAACANGQTSSDEETAQELQKAKSVDKGLSVQSAPTVAGDLGPEGVEKGGQAAVGPGLQRLAELAMKDLGARIGVEQAAIDIAQAEYVTWRDSSLGCPQPGSQYMQVLTNGSRIGLRVAKQVYQYHSGGNRPPFLCENPSKIEPLPYAHGEA